MQLVYLVTYTVHPQTVEDVTTAKQDIPAHTAGRANYGHTVAGAAADLVIMESTDLYAYKSVWKAMPE